MGIKKWLKGIFKNNGKYLKGLTLNWKSKLRITSVISGKLEYGTQGPHQTVTLAVNWEWGLTHPYPVDMSASRAFVSWLDTPLHTWVNMYLVFIQFLIGVMIEQVTRKTGDRILGGWAYLRLGIVRKQENLRRKDNPGSFPHSPHPDKDTWWAGHQATVQLSLTSKWKEISSHGDEILWMKR